FSSFAAPGPWPAAPPLEAVLPAILGVAGRLVEADAYAVWRRDAEGNWEAAWDDGLPPDYPRRLTGAPAGFVDQPVVVEDVTALPVPRDRQAAYRAAGIRSMLAVPLRIGGRRSGPVPLYHP